MIYISIFLSQTKTATAVSSAKVAISETSTTKTSPTTKATVNSTTQQSLQQVVQAVQRAKSATLAPTTPTKNAIVVANTGQTAQVMALLIDIN